MSEAGTIIARKGTTDEELKTFLELLQTLMDTFGVHAISIDIRAKDTELN